jgi:hypothetical protein
VETTLDADLSERERYYLYIKLPISVDEDSPTVEEFISDVWCKPITHYALRRLFTATFLDWVNNRKQAQP